MYHTLCYTVHKYTFRHERRFEWTTMQEAIKNNPEAKANTNDIELISESHNQHSHIYLMRVEIDMFLNNWL